MADADATKVVLLIEDDVLISDILARKLTQSGMRVMQALSGPQAFEFLTAGKIPGVILLDLILPGIDGFEILRRLKKDPALSKIPVIVLSNQSEPTQMAKALELGAVEYLIKVDVPLEVVVEKVRALS